MPSFLNFLYIKEQLDENWIRKVKKKEEAEAYLAFEFEARYIIVNFTSCQTQFMQSVL